MPPVIPSNKTLCPASPSLLWVVRVSLPHLPGMVAASPRPRYYAPLRLPLCPSWVASPFVLSLPNTLSCSFSLCLPLRRDSLTFRSFSPAPGLLFSRFPFSSGLIRKESDGSLKFPSYPFVCMPRSQTPVVSRTLAFQGSLAITI